MEGGIASQRRGSARPFPRYSGGCGVPQRAADSRESLPLAGVTAGTAPRCSALLPALSSRRSPLGAARSVTASAGGGTGPPRRVAAPGSTLRGSSTGSSGTSAERQRQTYCSRTLLCVLEKTKRKIAVQQVPADY